MLLNIIFGAPLWVWPLLAGLIWFGLRCSRQRQTSAVAVYLLPLLGLLSINTLVRMPNPEFVWGAYALAYLMGLAMGYQLQGRWLLRKDGRKVVLAGEWFTFAIVMSIFWLNFAGGTLRVVDPGVYGGVEFTLASALLFGAASGTFGGRALKVWRA